MKLFTKTFSLLFILWSFAITNIHAQKITVAIAANLQPVMNDLQRDFKTRTKIDVAVISGSSGNLATQIRNGAPYDIFMSADKQFAEALQKDGFTFNNAVVYAQGVLIIAGTQNLNFNDWNALLLRDDIRKIAIGNPAIAPYGKAAQQALKKAGVYDKVKSKFVFGESITQINTYITTGVVSVGFTTLSLIKDANNKKKLYYKVINPKDYEPIEQAMVMLKSTKDKPAAEKFYRYILSEPAKTIFKAYGYHTI
ncbi:MAG: molybdate ABC transporter substrate-binding protein [Bacteroidota bacterium]